MNGPLAINFIVVPCEGQVLLVDDSQDYLLLRFEKEVAAHKKTEDELKASHRKLSEKEAQLSVVNQEARSLESVLEELRKECQELKDSLESAKYALEQETLSRVDLENKLQSKDEELNFKKEMYNKVMICFLCIGKKKAMKCFVVLVCVNFAV